jgi:integrase
MPSGSQAATLPGQASVRSGVHDSRVDMNATPVAPGPTPATLAEAWALWLAYRRAGTRPLRASTLADYESIYRAHIGPRLGDTALATIDGAAIARFTVAMHAAGVGPKRAGNVLVPLRACLRWHHRLGALERDPSKWFDASAPAADERRILTLTQVEALIAATSAAYRAFVMTAAYTGMRMGELRALTWEDLDLDARTASVTKTYYREQLQRSTKSGHDRVAPLPAHVADALREWQADCPHSPIGLVFPRPSGRPIDPDDFRRRVFRPAAAAAGLPPGLRFHDLRHTSASLYLQHGATVREVMEIHGWRQMQTALRYLHTIESLNAAADRLSAARSGCSSTP